MFENCCFTSNFIRVEHPNFLGRQTTFVRFELSNKVQSNIPHLLNYILYIFSPTTYHQNVVKPIIKLNYQINSQSRITYLELFGCEWNIGQDRSPRQIVVECVKKSKVFVSFFLLKSWSLYFCFRHFFLFVNLNRKVVFSNGITNKYFYNLGNYPNQNKSTVNKWSYLHISRKIP